MTPFAEWTPLDGLQHWQREQPDAIYLTQPGSGGLEEFTWARVGDEVRRVAACLKALELGRGARIALLARNSAHWFMAELAIWMAGYVSVPIYPSLNEDTVRYILDHSGAQGLFIGALDDWDSMRGGIAHDLPVIRLPGAPALTDRADAPDWRELVSAHQPIDVPLSRGSEELASLIYTSGTTGQSKGVMLSFRSFAVSSTVIDQILPLGPADRMLSYLPLAHVFESAAVFASSLRYGFSVFFSESVSTFAADLRRARPTVFHSVPRLWLKFQLGILSRMPQPELDALLAHPATAASARRQVLQQLGLDCARLGISGSAALPPALLEWYRSLGLELLEGLGMSEDFGYSHLSRIGRVGVGYVGEPMRGVERRIDADGQLLVSSPARMLGYYREPQLTREAFTDDGFFRTGDKVEADEQGRLRLVGRIKEQFKTSKGKYVAPAPIESRLVHPCVEAVCVAGANLPQPFALMLLTADAQRRLDDPAGRLAVERELETLIVHVNDSLDPHERLDFVVLVRGPWTIANGFLTPTMKIRRNVLEQHYEADVPRWLEAGRAVIVEP